MFKFSHLDLYAKNFVKIYQDLTMMWRFMSICFNWLARVMVGPDHLGKVKFMINSNMFAHSRSTKKISWISTKIWSRYVSFRVNA